MAVVFMFGSYVVGIAVGICFTSWVMANRRDTYCIPKWGLHYFGEKKVCQCKKCYLGLGGKPILYGIYPVL